MRKKSNIFVNAKLIVLSSLLLSFCSWSVEKNWRASMGVSYFHPTSSVVQRIYGDHMVEVQGEIAWKLPILFDLWFQVGHISKRGSSINFCDKTDIHITPISIGLNYQCEWEYLLKPYAGIGISAVSVAINDCSEFVRKRLHKYGWGFIVRGGAEYDINDSLFCSGFLGYKYQKTDFDCVTGFSKAKINTSGFTVGLALGVRF